METEKTGNERLQKNIKKSGIEESYDDIREGKITHHASPEEMYKYFGI